MFAIDKEIIRKISVELINHETPICALKFDCDGDLYLELPNYVRVCLDRILEGLEDFPPNGPSYADGAQAP